MVLGRKPFELKQAELGPKPLRAVRAEQWWTNAGRTVFSQLIAYLSHIEFQSRVARYRR